MFYQDSLGKNTYSAWAYCSSKKHEFTHEISILLLGKDYDRSVLVQKNSFKYRS